MATRGIIARTTPTGFAGNYHHWDSYPSALGHTLYTLYQGHFQRDLTAMLTVLIDEHMAGWSSINDADFSLAPGFVNRSEEEEEEERKRRPQCYCHGDRHEQQDTDPWTMSEHGGAEFAYVFEEVGEGEGEGEGEEGKHPTIMTIYQRMDVERDEWEIISTIDMDAPSYPFASYHTTQ